MSDYYWGHRFLNQWLRAHYKTDKIEIVDINLFWSAYDPDAGKDIDVYILSDYLRSHFEFSSNIENSKSKKKQVVGPQLQKGTALASLIAGRQIGVAPRANLLTVTKIAKSGKPYDQLNSKLKILLKIINEKKISGSIKKNILCLSILGSGSPETQSLLQALSKQGVLIVLGLSKKTIFKFSKTDSILTVGSIDSKLKPSENLIADLYSPGKNIVSASCVDAKSYEAFDGGHAAFVAGVAAALWSKTSSFFNAAQVKEHLLTATTIRPETNIKLLTRKVEFFEPVWEHTESGIIETLKPNASFSRKLRCKNPVGSKLTFTIQEGFLPKGLSLSSDGIISGKPELELDAKKDHLNYFSTIIRATNLAGHTDRNISFIVTENETKVQQGHNIMAAVQLAKCNSGTNIIFGDEFSYGNSGADPWDAQRNGVDIAFQDCCFTSTTKVTMSDGSLKNISEINSGDYVLQNGTSQQVVAVIALPLTKTRKVYQINDLSLFLTDEHPLYGADNNVYALNPNLLFIQSLIGVRVYPIKIGTVLASQNGTVEVVKISEVNAKSTELLYHLFVEGNGSYFAGGILSHKKHADEISALITPVKTELGA